MRNTIGKQANPNLAWYKEALCQEDKQIEYHIRCWELSKGQCIFEYHMVFSSDALKSSFPRWATSYQGQPLWLNSAGILPKTNLGRVF